MIRSLAALSCAAALAAQTPPCISLNDATTSVSTAITLAGFTGPNVHAYQFTSPSTLVLRAAELFTARTVAPTSGYMTLEVWDENPATSLPGVRLAGGTWQAQPPLGVTWQGASFDGNAVIAANTNYWLVWREPGGSRIPYETGGVTMPYATFTAAGWVANATPRALKWRGSCSLLDDAGVLPVGDGCMATTGRIPAAFTNHAPSLGNGDFQFEASGFAAGTIALAIVGANAAWVGFPIPGAPTGCFLHADPMVTVVVPVGTGHEQAQHTVGCAGHGWLDLPIPAAPSLVGFVLDAQFAALDLASTDPLPFVFTNGVRVTLF
jgi:hypothetical protein